MQRRMLKAKRKVSKLKVKKCNNNFWQMNSQDLKSNHLMKKLVNCQQGNKKI